MAIILDLFEGLEQETKLCSICQRDLPVSSFAKEGSKGYLRYECRECASRHGKIVSKIKKSAPPVAKNHKCPVCDRTADQLSTYGKNKKSVWVADHDHETEVFRGWLCHKCNLGLGNLNDDYERCERASEYLKRFKNEVHH